MSADDHALSAQAKSAPRAALELTTARSDAHLCQILALQSRNYRGHLSAEEQDRNGFVTLRHDLALLRKMSEAAQQVIALREGRVVAYALVMPPASFPWFPLLDPMIELMSTMKYRGRALTEYRHYIMGQVCVDEAHRGTGLVRRLFAEHRRLLSEEYELCVTEAATRNIRSVRAHEKVGFETVRVYRDGTDEWALLVWDWRGGSASEG